MSQMQYPLRYAAWPTHELMNFFQYTIVSFCHFYEVNSFLRFCLLSCKMKTFKMESTLQGKNLLLMEQILFLKELTHWEGRKKWQQEGLKALNRSPE